MHAVVTGASGFLGSWIVRGLTAAGHEVTAIARSSRPWRLEGSGVVARDAAPERWPDLVTSAGGDVLVLADWAGVTSGSRGDDAQWRNVERHRALLDAAIASGARRIVGLGSQAEYARQDRAISESDPLGPDRAYGAAKVAAAEQLGSVAAAAGVEWAWARVFSVYGPLDNDGVVLERVASALLENRPLTLSSGRQAWSMLFASDAGRAIASIARPGAGVGAVNVAHPEAHRLRESIELFASALGGSGVLEFGAAAGPSLQADTTLLMASGWAPEIDHADGLRRAAAWYRGEPVRDPLSGDVLPGRPTATSSR
jgi:nucleoside-diphosphate-sugar epimerase